jgi:hypothetical protein
MYIPFRQFPDFEEKSETTVSFPLCTSKQASTNAHIILWVAFNLLLQSLDVLLRWPARALHIICIRAATLEALEPNLIYVMINDIWAVHMNIVLMGLARRVTRIELAK